MPMIDVYAKAGTFRDTRALARDLAAAVMRWEGVPEIPLFKDNTAAFVHDLPADALSDVSGSGQPRPSPGPDAGRSPQPGEAAGCREGHHRNRGGRSRRSDAGRP